MVTNVRVMRKPRSLGSSFLGSFHYRLGRTHKMAEDTLSQRSTKNRRRQVPAVLVEGIINMYTVDPHSSIRSCTTRPRPPPLDYRTTFGPHRRQFNPSLVIDRVPSELLVSGELDFRSIYLFNVLLIYFHSALYCSTLLFDFTPHFYSHSPSTTICTTFIPGRY